MAHPLVKSVQPCRIFDQELVLDGRVIRIGRDRIDKVTVVGGTLRTDARMWPVGPPENPVGGDC